MKLITAIIRPEKLDEMIGILIDHRVCGLTVTEVSGFGQQLGHLPGQPSWAGPYRAALLPKVRLEVPTLDDDAETMIEAIATALATTLYSFIGLTAGLPWPSTQMVTCCPVLADESTGSTPVFGCPFGAFHRAVTDRSQLLPTPVASLAFCRSVAVTSRQDCSDCICRSPAR